MQTIAIGTIQIVLLSMKICVLSPIEGISMKKKGVILFFAGLLTGMLGLCFAPDGKQLMASIQNGTLLPHIQNKITEFHHYFVADTKPIQKYGNLKLMDSIDHGKLWPKQKAQLRHRYLNTMEEQFQSLPSSQAKQEKLKNIENRIEAIEAYIKEGNA